MIEELARCFENKTVAVVGAGGYLGAALSQALSRTPARVLLVSRRPVACTGGAELITADVREPSRWDEIARRADVVFFVAGNSSVHAAVTRSSDSLTSMVLPLAHLFTAAQEARRRPRVVYASTARVYGIPRRMPVAEDTDVTPVTPFGLHNLLAEQTLEMASRQDVLDGVSLRLGNVYGPSPAPGSAERTVLNKMASRAVRGADLPLFGDGNYLRDFICIEDVVRAFLLVGGRSDCGWRLFNVASGHGITVADAFRLIVTRAEKAVARAGQVHAVPWPEDEPPIECRDFVADVSRIAAACGWRPRVSLTEGIDRLIAWMSSPPLSMGS